MLRAACSLALMALRLRKCPQEVRLAVPRATPFLSCGIQESGAVVRHDFVRWCAFPVTALASGWRQRATPSAWTAKTPPSLAASPASPPTFSLETTPLVPALVRVVAVRPALPGARTLDLHPPTHPPPPPPPGCPEQGSLRHSDALLSLCPASDTVAPLYAAALGGNTLYQLDPAQGTAIRVASFSLAVTGSLVRVERLAAQVRHPHFSAVCFCAVCAFVFFNGGGERRRPACSKACKWRCALARTTVLFLRLRPRFVVLACCPCSYRHRGRCPLWAPCL
jgi:hypothetical protein